MLKKFNKINLFVKIKILKLFNKIKYISIK